jgi:molybdate transport system ATP-binding protein
VVVMQDGRVKAVGSATSVLSLPVASLDRREAGALLQGQVESVDAKHRLATIALAATRLYVPEAGLKPGKKVRVRIPSRDVMLATKRPESLSALNVLEGIIQAMTGSDDATVDVAVNCGGDVILSRITSFSAERMGLETGMPVFAIIKTVALDS